MYNGYLLKNAEKQKWETTLIYHVLLEMLYNVGMYHNTPAVGWIQSEIS